MIKKIALIGPAYPYRGGIAQYTGELYTALSKKAEPVLYSFKRLYPSWLYPGESDKEIDAERTVDAKLIIDVYNPFSLMKLCRDIEKQGCEAAIITWWTLLWQPGMAYVARRLSKRGIKTVFLCHNLYDHNGKHINQKISKKLLAASDAYVVHSTDEEKELAELFPQKPVFRRLLPMYSQYPKATERLNKRGDLEVLFFGFIRPYKGLDVLLEALPSLNERTYVTIVGEYWGNKKDLEDTIKGIDFKNMETRLEYVSAEETANYFERADVAVLPYLSATGSAVLSVAYNYEVPVVASSVGGLKDGVIEGETGWLVDAGSSKDLALAINHVSRKKADDMKTGIREFCKKNDWDTMADKLIRFVDGVTRKP